jgi:hypothetical protein
MTTAGIFHYIRSQNHELQRYQPIKIVSQANRQVLLGMYGNRLPLDKNHQHPVFKGRDKVSLR